MRFRLLLFFLLLIVVSCSPKTEWSQFEWTGSTIRGKAFDRAAILVPVKLSSMPVL